MKFMNLLIAVEALERSKAFYDPDGHIIEVGESI